MIARLKCLIRGVHSKPARYPLGGWRCLACGAAGANLEEMGFTDGGFVPPMRRLYSRDERTFTRTDAYAPSRRGF